jgi:lipoprotein-anchoring transpeptidase ErfK/SrfK
MASAAVSPAIAQELTLESIETATPAETPDPEKIDPGMVKLQILLDRSRYSPGVIDGHFGENVAKAIAAFELANGLDADGKPDQQMWDKLAADGGKPVLTRYEITEKDANGPFLEARPEKLEDMAGLKRLAFTSPREGLAEKFHMDEQLLEALNPGVDFGKAGTEITVAVVNQRDESQSIARIEVSKSSGSLRAYKDDGTEAVFYPASIGSASTPSPSGTHKVRTIAPDPVYYYNPKELDFESVETDEPFEIAPGPNNPVGTVWIDLTEKGYGIHGTPEPSLIAKSESHGCVRLTNWDAEELSLMVRTGTVVEFRD